MKRPRNCWRHRLRRVLAKAADRVAECFARARCPMVITAVYGMTNPATTTANAVRASKD